MSPECDNCQLNIDDGYQLRGSTQLWDYCSLECLKAYWSERHEGVVYTVDDSKGGGIAGPSPLLDEVLASFEQQFATLPAAAYRVMKWVNGEPHLYDVRVKE